MKKYKVKFLIENPFLDSYGWWYQHIPTFMKVWKAPNLRPYPKDGEDKDYFFARPQEYAEHGGWTK